MLREEVDLGQQVGTFGAKVLGRRGAGDEKSHRGQEAEVRFEREEWKSHGLTERFIAVHS